MNRSTRLAVLIGLPVVGVVGVVLLCCGLGGVGLLRLSTPNARCPQCGKEFIADEEYRGSFMRTERCPRCGSGLHMGGYFDEYDRVHGVK